LRDAAVRALQAPAHTVREANALPQRKLPQPTRRPGGQRRGEFDAISTDLVATAGRMPRPGTPAADAQALSVWAPVAHTDATGEPVASPRSRGPLTEVGATISETSGAATTRAHLRAVPDARGTTTTHRPGTDEEADITS
jgi:hypothetical protein